MRLTARSNYAILTLLDIANHSKSGAVRAMDIAKRQILDQDYLYQILRRLRLHGLIRSEKGRGGGYVLAKPASAISLYDVFRSAEDTVNYTDSLRQPTKKDTDEYAALYDVLFDVHTISEDILRKRSLSDLF